jgi:uncharacterized membrane protein YfcA
MSYLALFVFGIGVGVLSGLLGIGGGIALVPGLMLLFKFSQPMAQGTSLAVLSLPIVVFAALVYYQRGFIHLPVVGWVAAGFVIGAFVGALAVAHVPQTWLQTAFGVLLLYVGFSFIVAPSEARAGAALPSVVATLLTFVLGRWLGRWRAVATVKPEPGEDMEYHI